MNVSQLIDRNCSRVSILEDTRAVSEWFRDKDYFAVIDEALQVVGIITLKDLLQEKLYQLIDCAFTKPVVLPSDSLQAVYEKMTSSGHYYLPVYESNEFVGVISLQALTAELIIMVE